MFHSPYCYHYKRYMLYRYDAADLSCQYLGFRTTWISDVRHRPIRRVEGSSCTPGFGPNLQTSARPENFLCKDRLCNVLHCLIQYIDIDMYICINIYILYYIYIYSRYIVQHIHTWSQGLKNISAP